MVMVVFQKMYSWLTKKIFQLKLSKRAPSRIFCSNKITIYLTKVNCVNCSEMPFLADTTKINFSNLEIQLGLHGWIH